MPAVNPETFRMIESIEKKSRELKRREEELRIKERKIKAIEAKVNKDLEKIEKGLSQSKQQLGIQDEKNKENVQALIKVYSSIKPGEAANLIEAIDDIELIYGKERIIKLREPENVHVNEWILVE